MGLYHRYAFISLFFFVNTTSENTIIQKLYLMKRKYNLNMNAV